jgi:pimeloyl-ACP methyl ester carboxylesterase
MTDDSTVRASGVTFADSAGLVDVAGFRLRIQCRGRGEPTVVIDAAAGRGLADWTDAVALLSSSTRVCAYDRAGVGGSDPGPKPRTASRKLAELRTLLAEAGIAGPFVVVGHSIGGLHAQLFARAQPGDVAALVLVDPSFADLHARLVSSLGPWRAALLWRLQAATAGEGMSRHDWDASFAETAAAGPLPDIPLVVVSAGRPSRLRPPLRLLVPPQRIMWAMTEGHRALAASVPQGRHVVAAASDHATIPRAPEVVEAIAGVVAAVR